MQNRPASSSRRNLLLRGAGAAVLAGLALTGCGFKLRGAQSYAFSSIFINAASASTVITELERNIASGGSVRVVTDAKQQAKAQVILDVVADQREKTVVGLTSSGQVREFQLRLRFRFKLRSQNGKELLPETELLQQRDISFNESAVLSKEVEEAQLYRNMQSDIVQQIARRLAAVREL
jgi:LPS-assembly lipoprotein